MNQTHNITESNRQVVLADSAELDQQQSLQDHLIRRIAEAFDSGDTETFAAATAVYEETTAHMEDIRVDMFYRARLEDLKAQPDKDEDFNRPTDKRQRVASLMGAVALMGAHAQLIHSN